MRLHTDKLTRTDLDRAAEAAGVTMPKAEPHGSRSRNHAFDVALSGSGVMGGMYGNLGYPTATWDEWGIFLAHLYAVDSELIAGPYRHNREDDYESFDFLTDHRYSGDPDSQANPRPLTPGEQHKRHRWTWAGVEPTYCFVPGTVNSYSEFGCKCGAVMRRVLDYIGEDGQPTSKRPVHMMGAAS